MFDNETFRKGLSIIEHPIWICPQCSKKLGPYTYASKNYLRARAKEHWNKKHRDNDD